MSSIAIIIPVMGGIFAGLTALLAVLWFIPKPQTRYQPVQSSRHSPPRQFRFRDGALVSHSDGVGFLLPEPINHATAWRDLVETLSDLDPEIASDFHALQRAGRPFENSGLFGPDRITVLGHRDGSDLCVSVATTGQADKTVRIERASLAALRAEVALMSQASRTNPGLSWVTDAEGQVIWSNASYLQIVTRCFGAEAANGWPLRTLFALGPEPTVGKSRRKCCDKGNGELWFDVTVSPPDAEGRHYAHALPLEGLIRSEDTLRSFNDILVQSVSILPLGVGVFDREGQLALFNQPLLDMTGLDVDWMSSRPRMAEILDVMRDRQKLPEPRDYKTWRNALTGTPDTPLSQTRTETWTLSDGTHLELTAHPQGNGSITLLLEDISQRTARDRTERKARETMSGLLDVADEGLLMFDADGTRTAMNALAERLWQGPDPSGSLPETLDACIAYWKPLHDPTSVWGDIREFLRSPSQERAPWAETLRTADGRDLRVRIHPQAGGGMALAIRADCGPGPDLSFDPPADGSAQAPERQNA